MVAPFDVFKLANEEGVWIECAETLPLALSVIRENGAGKYLVFSQTTQHKHLYEMTSSGELVLLNGGEAL